MFTDIMLRRSQFLVLLLVVGSFWSSMSLPVECLSLASNQNHSKSILSKSGIVSDDEVALYGLYNMFGGGNPNSTPDGRKLVEGDIVLPETDDGEQLNQRKATADSSVYWPHGEVIYTYHESINLAEKTVIEAAMQHWRQHTCITFRPRQAGDYFFVRFRSDTQGCWSLVGRQADRAGQGQDVSIGAGCANLNVVVHEIGHVIGFYHEQSRSDRDQYIDIVWNNVLPGYALQFRKESDSNYGIPYDLTSTMQYPQWAFSKEIFEKSTIVARNPAYQRFLSKNYPLSFRDRMLANKMYQCTRSCGQQSCSNGGYSRTTGSVSLLGQASCSCDCPPNFSGSKCETQIRESYYDTLPCGGIVTKRGVISTPGYPQRTAPFQSCMWDIRGPPDSRVRIKFDGFGFAPRFTKAGTKVINKCFNETVELRLRSANMHDGETVCGNDIAPGKVVSSDGPRAIIIITANDKMVGTGLSAQVVFVRRRVSQLGNEEEEEITDDDTTAETPEPSVEPSTENPQQTRQPLTQQPVTIAPFTLQPFTMPTLPPIILPTLPPMSPPPPMDLLEQYEKESKVTFPPVIPIFG